MPRQVHVQSMHGVGQGGYDCQAGASNWIQGWSSKKKLRSQGLGWRRFTYSMV